MAEVRPTHRVFRNSSIAVNPALLKYMERLSQATGDMKDEGGNNVVLKKMIIIPEGHKEFVLDIVGDQTQPKTISIKEGSKYVIKLIFRVQREKVDGLTFVQDHYSSRVKVERSANINIGSFGPKTEPHEFISSEIQAPKRVIQTERYTVKSKINDDQNNTLEWTWCMDMKRDWED